MPRKSNRKPIIGSKSQAFKRMYASESRFIKDSKLKDQYCEFMEEYERLGRMTVVPFEQDDRQEDKEINYLSHHPVWKNPATRDKICVVFDGSAADVTGNTLNQTLPMSPPVNPPSVATDLRGTHDTSLGALPPLYSVESGHL